MTQQELDALAASAARNSASAAWKEDAASASRRGAASRSLACRAISRLRLCRLKLAAFCGWAVICLSLTNLDHLS